MHTLRDSIINAIMFFGVFCLVFFSAFTLRKIIEGPVISLTYPTDSTIVSTSTVTVTGTVKNVAFLYINGRKIVSDTTGNFSESIFIFPGYNVIELRARDRFNNEIAEYVRIVQSTP